MIWFVSVVGTIEVPDNLKEDSEVENYISSNMDKIKLTDEYEYGTEEDFVSLS